MSEVLSRTHSESISYKVLAFVTVSSLAIRMPWVLHNQRQATPSISTQSNTLTPADDSVPVTPVKARSSHWGIYEKGKMEEPPKVKFNVKDTLSIHEDNGVDRWQSSQGIHLGLQVLEHSTGAQHRSTTLPSHSKPLNLSEWGGLKLKPKALRQITIPLTLLLSRKRDSEYKCRTFYGKLKAQHPILILPKDTAVPSVFPYPSICLKADLCEVFVSSHLFPLTVCLRWM